LGKLNEYAEQATSFLEVKIFIFVSQGDGGKWHSVHSKFREGRSTDLNTEADMVISKPYIFP
jgi:hypothetical protein